jgi:hypothetical protein
MIVDIVASSVENSNDVEGNDKISVRELELVIGHEVDPWTRLDTVITFSDFEDPTLEGAYITWTKIPHLKTRFGRMRTKLGKANALHRDQLETVDAPLVIQQYLGVEGYFKSRKES